MKPFAQIAVLAVLLSASACSDESGFEGRSTAPEDFVNDSGDAANANEAAYAKASPELRKAASVKGDLACALPQIADARAGSPANSKSPKYSYSTNAAPPQVYAFYRLAAEARGGTTQVSGPPGLVDVVIALPDETKCRAIGQAQLSGDTQVTVELIR